MEAPARFQSKVWTWFSLGVLNEHTHANRGLPDNILKYGPHRHQPSIIGLVVEFVVAIDEARVRFTDDAFLFVLSFLLPLNLLFVG